VFAFFALPWPLTQGTMTQGTAKQNKREWFGSVKKI
jgi:hypothetical protein